MFSADWRTFGGVVSKLGLQVVLTDSSLSEQLKVNAITHAKNVCFISARTPGLFSQIFCDLGESFTVADVNGENPISTMCASISKEADGVVTCLDETRHGLEDGDHVSFTEVVGMTELNDTEPRPVKVARQILFSGLLGLDVGWTVDCTGWPIV